MLCDEEECIKVIVVGDGNVGKTCMLRRFVRGDFVEQYRKTIGAEFMEKDVFLRSSNTTVKLMLWDTAGQEVFNALTQAYYRGAGAAILTFSTVDRDSFMNIAGWKQRVESVCGPITMVLCQTKFDLSHEAVITNTEAEKLANQLGVPLFRVSTKDDFNVTQLFEFTAQQCVENSAQDEEQVEDMPKGNRLDDGKEPTAGTPAAVASSTTSDEQHGGAGVPAARAPNAAATSSSPPAAGNSSLSGDAIKHAFRKSVKSKNGGRNEKKALSSAKNSVTLKEQHGQGHHKKKQFKCSLC
ncbi:putative small G-protein [Leishmania infantum JPCM5]|uniref:Small_G-protein_-_putative n=2 Tax=Leishmania infantum TaxID=5671 RepID=A0A6L0XUT9_LEIIN|nr:putative small G-protein [Leishmania infantum JPCM5]CAC9553049.1 small_G-protein_-_putative [Leishmania infantum]CAM72462.1 putative small G-protein [Leishmania infantum JPCM5]SUZ47033.1 small_G-protein_-_putative [Leishmania infantum]|eukprot:XP_001469355.1 putative small G-protein [Leishmania infantum JPCM5]